MLVNGERALAYIVTVDDIKPLEGYDRVEYARVGGWWCVVRKDELHVGDKAVYFEVDSLVNKDDERFSFMEPRKYKVKTQKMCKVISQGLLLPLTEFPELSKYDIGTDVTKKLGVTYYVKEDNDRKAKGGNPNEKYNRMAAKHPKLAKKKWFRWLMKRMWGKRLLFVFLGRHIDEKKYKFPAWIKRTDEDRCLIGDTKIQTDKGIFRIADIVNKKLDVKVKSYNFSTGKFEYKPIVSYQKYPNNEELLEIEYPYRPYVNKKNRVVCSKDHKFFVNGTYVKAEDIVVGDKILMPYISYDDDAIAALYGMILGDACIGHDERCASKNIRIGVTHGEDQFDYMKIKQKMFGVDNFHILIGGKSGYCDKKIYRGQIITDPKITESVLNDCFINKKKTVTNSMANKINKIGLALWYLDDGSLKHRDDNSGCNPHVVISSNAYTKEENEILINMLKNKFGIDCNIRREKDKYWCIYITVEGTKRLFEIIGDYIPMSMKYKAPKEYENIPCVLEDVVFERKIRLIEIPVTNVKIYNGKRNHKNIYDIEVADNHNFFANNVLVHNCENMPWLLDIKDPFVVSEKIDGCFDYNTTIRTNEGLIPIGRIVNQKLPVLVASYNEDKQIVEYKNIVDYHKIKVSHPVLKIGVGYRGHGNRDKYITCTDNHEFYTPTGWKQAKDLKQGDIVYHFTESFPYEIKQLILGSLLGDASINANNKDGGYRCVHFTQSDKQIAYFNYKKNLLGKYALGERTRTSGYGSLMHDMHTTTNLELNKFLNEHCMKNGKKFVTQEWCNELDPMGLAFWYMDDGSISNRDNDRCGCRIHISTNGFSLQENETLANMLRDRFGIEATIGDKETYKGYTLILNVKNTERFCSLIAPYVCDNMKYKLPKKYQDIKCCYDNVCFDSGMNIVEVDIKSIENVKEHKEYFFDITVEDNHNYFAHSILVHNCSTTFFLDATKRKHDFGVCSRNVRQMTPDAENYHTKSSGTNVYWEMALKYNIQNVLEKIVKKHNVKRVVLQGETYGESVQGNPLHIKGRDFAAFNLIFDGERLGSLDAKKILDEYGVPFVPIIDEHFIMPDKEDFESLKLMADGKSVISPKYRREGFVYRSLDGKQSCKNVSREYLLKIKD